MIIIPMAGLSSRFLKAGYTRPKYELPVRAESLFASCVRSFERYFASERFVFVCRAGINAEGFIDAECTRLGIADQVIVSLHSATRGQAESVLLGLHGAKFTGSESLLIFNIDTIRPHYTFPPKADAADGYLEVFAGVGDHWSFVKPAASFSHRVVETSEKKRISNLACTGLYHFSKSADFANVCTDALSNFDTFREQWGELYIAPLYNAMIRAGKRIVYHETPLEQVHFSGTPDEYEALIATQCPLF